MATASTARAALATVEAADAAASLAQLPGVLLPALVNLVGADSALWTELDLTPAPGQAAGSLPGRIVGYPEPLLTEETALALERHARDFPLTCHTRPGGDGRVTAPVESGGEAAVHLGAGHDRRREGEHGHGEAQRIRVSLGHARGGRGDADSVDLAFKPRPMGGPKGLRARIAIVIGERVGERGGGTVADLGVAVEPGEHVARRGTAQSHERREGDSGGECEHDDPGDAKDARRELPGACP